MKQSRIFNSLVALSCVMTSGWAELSNEGARRIEIFKSTPVGKAYPLLDLKEGDEVIQRAGATIRLTGLSGSGGEILLGSGNESFQLLGGESIFKGKIRGGAPSDSLQMSGNYILVKGGSELTLAGSSTYASRTFVEGQSSIVLQHEHALGESTSAAYANGKGSYEIDGTGFLITKNFVLNGAGKNGDGSLVNRSGSNRITGEIQLGWTESPEEVVIGVAKNSSLKLDGSLIGESPLIKRGMGALELGHKNSYEGATQVDEGTLLISCDGAIPENSALTIGVSSSLKIGADSAVILSELAGRGSIEFAGNGSRLEVNRSGDFSGKISGSGAGLCVTGGGRVILSGDSGYLSPTTVSDNGTIVIKNSRALGKGEAFASDGGAYIFTSENPLQMGNDFTLSGRALKTEKGSVTLTGEVAIKNGAELDVADELILVGKLSGNGALKKSGDGTLRMRGASSQSGGLSIDAGSFVCESSEAIASGTPITLSGGNLEINAKSGLSSLDFIDKKSRLIAVSELTLARVNGTVGEITLSSAPFAISGNFTSRFSGQISGGSGTVTIKDGAKLYLDGKNSYTSRTLVTDGAEVVIGSNDALGKSSCYALGNGSYKLDGDGLKIGNDFFLASSEKALENIRGNNQLTGDITLLSKSEIAVENSLTLDGEISGSGKLLKTGSGTLILKEKNNYSGKTEIKNGALIYAKSGAIPEDSPITISKGASLEITAPILDYLTIANLENGGKLLQKNGAILRLQELGGEGTVTLDGTLFEISGEGASTFGGVIEGTTQKFSVTGGHTVTLTGSSTINSPVHITSGSLMIVKSDRALGDGTVLVDGSCEIGDGVTLQNPFILSGKRALESSNGKIDGSVTLLGKEVGISGKLLLSGAISGEGALLTEGAITLTGANSYSGKTGVKSGDLFVGAGALPKESAVNLGKGAILHFIGDKRSAHHGAIFGGKVVVESGASLFLEGRTSPETELVVASGGRLLVNGSLKLKTPLQIEGDLSLNGSHTGQINVGKKGGFEGAGVVDGELINFGTLTTSKKLTINGDLTFKEGSALKMKLYPDSNDLLQVNGHVRMERDVTLHIEPTDGTKPGIEDYLLIDSSEKIEGSFASFSVAPNPSETFLNSLHQVGGQIFLRNETRPFTHLLNGENNSGKVASYWDKIVEMQPEKPGLRAPLAEEKNPVETLLYHLRLASKEQLTLAADQSAPSPLKALAASAENSTLGVRDMLLSRNHFASKRACRPVRENQQDNLWFSGSSAATKQANVSSDITGFDAKTATALVGIDHENESSFVIGGAAGYSHSDLRLRQGRGSGKIDSGYAAIYTHGYSDYHFLDLELIGAISRYRENRAINFQLHTLPYSANASSTFHGAQLAVHAGFGLIGRWKGFEARPFISADYLAQQHQKFTESGSGLLDLSVNSSNYAMIRGEGGVHLSWSTRRTIIGTKLSYIRDKSLSGSTYTARYKDVSETFTITGLRPNRSLIAPGADIALLSKSGKTSLILRYNGEFGSHYTNDALGLTLITRF